MSTNAITGGSNAMANAVAPSAAGGQPSASPRWFLDFCNEYAPTMLDFGWWFLFAALIIGAAGALVLVYRTAVPVQGESGGGGQAGGAAGLQQIADALKGLVEAFSKAPTWLAMLGGGILLLWMAGNVVPERCYAVTDGTGSPGAVPAAKAAEQ